MFTYHSAVGRKLYFIWKRCHLGMEALSEGKGFFYVYMSGIFHPHGHVVGGYSIEQVTCL